MTHLVVLGLDSPAKAEEVCDLAKQELLQLQDAAYAYRDDRGKVRIHQSAASSNRARRCSCSPARPPSTR
jgi:uncharacterized membrane protein